MRCSTTEISKKIWKTLFLVFRFFAKIVPFFWLLRRNVYPSWQDHTLIRAARAPVSEEPGGKIRRLLLRLELLGYGYSSRNSNPKSCVGAHCWVPFVSGGGGSASHASPGSLKLRWFSCILSSYFGQRDTEDIVIFTPRLDRSNSGRHLGLFSGYWMNYGGRICITRPEHIWMTEGAGKTPWFEP